MLEFDRSFWFHRAKVAVYPFEALFGNQVRRNRMRCLVDVLFLVLPRSSKKLKHWFLRSLNGEELVILPVDH